MIPVKAHWRVSELTKAVTIGDRRVTLTASRSLDGRWQVYTDVDGKFGNVGSGDTALEAQTLADRWLAAQVEPQAAAR